MTIYLYDSNAKRKISLKKRRTCLRTHFKFLYSDHLHSYAVRSIVECECSIWNIINIQLIANRCDTDRRRAVPNKQKTHKAVLPYWRNALRNLYIWLYMSRNEQRQTPYYNSCYISSNSTHTSKTLIDYYAFRSVNTYQSINLRRRWYINCSCYFLFVFFLDFCETFSRRTVNI